MARVFTMDALAKCAEQDVTNKFDMIVLGSYYARQLRKGKPTIVPADPGQSHVVNALRDFESGEVDLKALQDEYVESKQKEKKPTPSTNEEEK